MATRETTKRERELDSEIDAYREAATAALDQLEWAIGYLNRIGKTEIAGVLGRNRRFIINNMR